jgi:UDP-glucose 4-epimerase
MRILLTGAFGNIGIHTLEELIVKGHEVRCFDVRTKINQKTFRKYSNQVEVFWGDLRNSEDIALAVKGQELVLHLGFVIPKLSMTGVNSEDEPELARQVNVGGTRNLLSEMKNLPVPPKIIFASSLHVYGKTQDQPPPRKISDPVNPIEHYAKHKVECERMVRVSGLEWAIFRLPATLPIRLILDKGMFDVPLDNRIEYAHGRDIGTAFTNAVTNPNIWGKTLLIGGGKFCQFYYRDLVGRIMKTLGIGNLPETAFTKTPYSTDWLDTTESEQLLRYQNRTLEDYLNDMKHLLGWRLPLIRTFRPLVKKWLLSQSPYYQTI